MGGARVEMADMIHALCTPTEDGRPGDKIMVLVDSPAARKSAANMLYATAELIDGDYGDIWFRDTAPVFQSRDRAVAFGLNGWGGKYVFEHDDKVADTVARLAGADIKRHDFVLEGGAVDGDGAGTFLTTRECLLNPNRNPGWKTEADAEAALKTALGARKIIWLDKGLLNDHTDGHVDNIARFVAPGVVVCQSPSGANDPNAAVLEDVFKVLSESTTADGTPLKVIRIPSPGYVVDAKEEIVPASHLNFLVGNSAVVVPFFTPYIGDAAKEAVSILQSIFPNRKVVGLSARFLLTGGGAFHCITQQQPA